MKVEDWFIALVIPVGEQSSESIETVNMLRERGIEASPRSRKPGLRSFPNPGAIFAAGAIGEIVIPLTQTLGPPFFTLLGAWLTARYGRKIRVKIGDVEAEGQTVEEIEALLRKAKEYQEMRSTNIAEHGS